jgi:hypothetical protein
MLIIMIMTIMRAQRWNPGEAFRASLLSIRPYLSQPLKQVQYPPIFLDMAQSVTRNMVQSVTLLSEPTRNTSSVSRHYPTVNLVAVLTEHLKMRSVKMSSYIVIIAIAIINNRPSDFWSNTIL